jgi:hypothetical protein
MLRLPALAVLLLCVTASVCAEEKENKVEFTVHKGYFEKRTSGLKGEPSFVAVTDYKTFDDLFGFATVMKNPNKPLPKDTFDNKIVVATVKRGNMMVTYTVEKVTADGDTLTVRYKSEAGPATSATFASPLILSVDKGKYTKVVFIDNGKEAGKVDIGK